jgi:conjugative transfer region protein TrbK
MRSSLLANRVTRSRPGRTLIVLGLVAGIISVVLWLSAQTTGDEGAAARQASPAKTDALGAALVRCNALGSAALDDAACKRAWAESRRRFLGGSDPQSTGSTATVDAPTPEAR